MGKKNRKHRNKRDRERLAETYIDGTDPLAHVWPKIRNRMSIDQLQKALDRLRNGMTTREGLEEVMGGGNGATAVSELRKLGHKIRVTWKDGPTRYELVHDSGKNVEQDANGNGVVKVRKPDGTETTMEADNDNQRSWNNRPAEEIGKKSKKPSPFKHKFDDHGRAICQTCNKNVIDDRRRRECDECLGIGNSIPIDQPPAKPEVVVEPEPHTHKYPDGSGPVREDEVEPDKPTPAEEQPAASLTETDTCPHGAEKGECVLRDCRNHPDYGYLPGETKKGVEMAEAAQDPEAPNEEESGDRKKGAELIEYLLANEYGLRIAGDLTVEIDWEERIVRIRG